MWINTLERCTHLDIGFGRRLGFALLGSGCFGSSHFVEFVIVLQHDYQWAYMRHVSLLNVIV